MSSAFGPASFDPQLIKDVLQYYKGLITSIITNRALVEQSFGSALPRDEDDKHHTLQPGDFKRHVQKHSLQPYWKGL